jgi:two-component sensor histidine kinase
LKLSLAALEERLYATAAIAGSSIKVQAQKTKDVVALTKSVASTIQLMAELQGEMHDRGEMVSIPKNKFKEAIENALRQTKSVEEQQTLIRVFEGIHQASKE